MLATFYFSLPKAPGKKSQVIEIARERGSATWIYLEWYLNACFLYYVKISKNFLRYFLWLKKNKFRNNFVEKVIGYKHFASNS